MDEERAPTPAFALWKTVIDGTLQAGYVRVHVYIDESWGEPRVEVEYTETLGANWQSLPEVG